MTNTMKGALIYFLGSFGTAAALYTMSVSAMASEIPAQNEQNLTDSIQQEVGGWDHEKLQRCDQDELYKANQGYLAIKQYWEDNCSGYTYGEQADLCEQWYPDWAQYHSIYMALVDYCE